MLRYIANSVQTEIHMAVHQTSRYSMNPMRIHELAIIRIGKYLVDNPDYGVIYTIDKTKGLGFMLIPTLQVTGIQMTPQMLKISYQEQDLLSYMQADLSSGVANFKLRLHFILLNLSILTCLKRYVNHYQSNSW